MSLQFIFHRQFIAEAEVGSGVSDQPFGDEETRLGAINRALRAARLKAVQSESDWKAVSDS